MLIGFNKPYGVLSQFTPEPGSKYRTLAEFGFPPQIYPIGRLDADSEGLLLLSDEPALNERLLHPRHNHNRLYWAQVEGEPKDSDLQQLQKGIIVQGRRTLPCHAWRLVPSPEIPSREPPIRFRKNVLDSWIALELTEGKNRQVRRVTSAIGFPTLRLLRRRIGKFEIGTLGVGKFKELNAAEREAVFAT